MTTESTRMEGRYPVEEGVGQGVELNLFESESLVCSHGKGSAAQVDVNPDQHKRKLKVGLGV